jgi:hypothetical protein
MNTDFKMLAHFKTGYAKRSWRRSASPGIAALTSSAIGE